MWDHMDWGGGGHNRDRAKGPQSSPTSRAARSLSSACLLMLPTARTPPSPPPCQALPGHHCMGPCPGCSSDLHQSAQCQKCCWANRPAQGHQWILLLGLQQPGPLVPAPPTLCPTLKRAQLPFKCPTCKHPTEKCAGGTRGSPGARLDVTSDLPALEATAAPTGERLISCCCSGLWLGRTGLAWGTHTAPPPSFSLIVLCTGLNHVPHKIHVPPRSSECNLLWK